MQLERRTLGERYAGAMSTSDMTISPEGGDADVIIAAGMMDEHLGAMLHRLRMEWDQAGGDVRLARHAASMSYRRAATLRKAAGRDASPAEAVGLNAKADALIREAKASLLTARALAMAHMESLGAAKAALMRYAARQATLQRFMRPDDVVAKIAGRVLEAFVDDTCHACSGRGFTGGYLEPKKTCLECVSSRKPGRRPMRLGDTESDHQFGGRLLMLLEAKESRVTRHMRRKLSHMASVGQSSDADLADLRRRLAMLRSDAAQED